jgi:hypothetical protein
VIEYNREFILNEWLPALRSGEYKQGDGALLSHNEQDEPLYCCLGVACQLLVNKGILELQEERYGIGELGGSNWDDATLPQTAAEYIGVPPEFTLPRTNYYFEGVVANEDTDAIAESAIELNDELGLNFKQIAAIIEKMVTTGALEDGHEGSSTPTWELTEDGLA